MGKPDPPPAPDYQGAANAQGAANIEAARLTGKLNNPNVYSPYGTQTVKFGEFDEAAYNAAMDDYRAQQQSGGSIKGAIAPPPAPNRSDYTTEADQPTIYQTLSPDQQRVLDSSNATKISLSNLANQGATNAASVLNTPFNYNNAPALSSSNLLANAPGMRSTDFTANVSAMPGSAEAMRTQAYNAAMSRVSEDTGIQRDQKQSDLIANGIRPGTKAYNDAMFQIDRGYNDARQQAILGSGVEAQRQSAMDLANRQQGVSEQERMFGAGTTAQQQAINQQLQQFNASSEARRQSIAEALALRQTPLNEINALQSGSQIVNPFSMPGYAQNSNIAAAPVYQATSDAGQFGMDVYNQKAASNDAFTSGLFSLGSAGVKASGSDRRIKRHICRIGTHPLGVGLYSFEYKPRYQAQWGRGPQVGVMAQEVLTVKPDAVSWHPDGYLMVDYGRLS